MGCGGTELSVGWGRPGTEIMWQSDRYLWVAQGLRGSIDDGGLREASSFTELARLLEVRSRTTV